MKFEKFISFSVFNAFLLLVMATTIASCQKKSIHKIGYFTKYPIKERGRFPASFVPTKQIGQFDNSQDSKQILIYCAQNSLKMKHCYEHHFNQILSDFINTYGPISGEELASLKEINSFENVSKKVDLIRIDILNSLNPKINDVVAKREEFCKLNSKKNPEKCMTHFLKRDSIALLNAYQFKNKRMNGHEYLYLKNVIKKDLNQKLMASVENFKSN